MNSLWTGDVGHVDITQNGVHMCMQISGMYVSNAMMRKSFNEKFEQKYGHGLSEGGCNLQKYPTGVMHSGPLSIWANY